MPFLAPFVPALIGAGGAIGSSLLGSKLGNVNPTPTEQNALNLTGQAQKTGLNAGTGLLGMGQSAVQQPINYWSSILSGNQGAINSALAPEISRIGQGYQAAANTSAALNPRGGPSASFLSQLPFMQQRDVSTLMQQARPQAAQQLGGLGGGLLSSGTGLINSATGAGRDILSQEANLRAQTAQNSRGIGQGIFSMFQQYGMPAIQQILARMGQGGGTGSGTSTGGILGEYP